MRREIAVDVKLFSFTHTSKPRGVQLNGRRKLFTSARSVLLRNEWHLWGEYWDSRLLFGAQLFLGEALHFVSPVNSQLTHTHTFLRPHTHPLRIPESVFDGRHQARGCGSGDCYKDHISSEYYVQDQHRCQRTHTQSYRYAHAHARIMQIAVPPVSVITELCSGYNRGMLSSVKSCGQS